MIDIDDLGFAYTRKGKPLFEHLNLHLPAGTICGMLGPNGAGKSTLLRMLAGLTFPQHGTCRVLGHTPAQRRPDFLADIYLLPEDLFVPPMSARVYVRRYGSLYPRFDHTGLLALMDEFALPVDKKLTTLSQGQKKKFLLAFGIATNTRLLIMDEPTNGLDIPSKSQFRKVLINHFDPDRTFIISTHQVHDLQSLIDPVLIIAEGRILLSGPLFLLYATAAYSLFELLAHQTALELTGNSAALFSPLDPLVRAPMLNYFALHALVFAGAIHFRSHALIRTTILLFGIGLGIGLVFMLTMRIVYWDYFSSWFTLSPNAPVNMTLRNFWPEDSPAFDRFAVMLGCLWVLYLAWLRLLDHEVQE